MAIAKCGTHWGWDSPMWCSGKIIKSNVRPDRVETMCLSCPWYKGNKISEESF